MSEPKRPKFSMDFIGFSNYGPHVEASIALSPEYDLKFVTSFLHNGEDSARVIQLIFYPTDKKPGRRGYELQQKWEQTPNGEIDTQNDTKKEPTK